jgi:hypothetical protein
MKKILFILLMCVATLTATAQNTIKFLGIPVDGTKQEMIEQLQTKGFEYNNTVDGEVYLKGEFNGIESAIFINTVKNKVWRICVANYEPYDNFLAKIAYNNLFKQFSNNEKYILSKGDKISNNEDISYEMIVNKKKYESIFKLKDETINGYVWITIQQISMVYSVMILYDNLNNAANGEDL